MQRVLSQCPWLKSPSFWFGLAFGLSLIGVCIASLYLGVPV